MPSTSLGLNGGVVVLVLCLSLRAAAATPDASLDPLAAIWAGGLVDLMTTPKRDVTASFGALASMPLFTPEGRRGPTFTAFSAGVPRSLRIADAKLAGETPALVGVCHRARGAEVAFEVLFDRARGSSALSLVMDPRTAGTPEAPVFLFHGLEASDLAAAPRLQRLRADGWTCSRAYRDARGEVFFGGVRTPSLFEAPPFAPFPEDSNHLLDLIDDPDGAIVGLLPVELFVQRHPNLARPRTAGLLSLLALSDVFSAVQRLTLVAVDPATPARAVLLAEGQSETIVLGFERGAYTTPRFVSAADALGPAWSRWSWSMMQPRLRAEVLLEGSAEANACLDALATKPADDGVSLQVQRCFDRSLPDAGPSFRVRRERWLEPVRALEAAASERVERFCLDQAALAEVAFFRPAPPGGKDVGPLLHPLLGWEPQAGAKAVPGSLKLPTDLSAKFAASGFMELPEADLAALSGVDLSFFHKLKDFERWELVGPSGALEAKSRLNAAEAPLPEFSQLLRAAQLHLRRAARTGKLAATALEVRQAARLAWNTELRVGQHLAFNLLRVEARAHEWAGAALGGDPGWEPLPAPLLERVERVVRAAAALQNPAVSEQTFSRARACDRVTSCAALTEVSAVTAGLHPLLREPWRARQGALLTLLGAPSATCSWKLARYWAERPMVDVAEAQRSRLQEVIAGELLGGASRQGFLPDLGRAYP